MRPDADFLNKRTLVFWDDSIGILSLSLSHCIIQHYENHKSCDIFLKGPSTTTETETVAKYEIMDGAPVKGKLDLNTSKTLLVCEKIYVN